MCATPKQPLIKRLTGPASRLAAEIEKPHLEPQVKAPQALQRNGRRRSPIGRPRGFIARANLGAIYSPDGMTIQFDNETIWQRALEAPPPPLRASAPVNVGRAAIFDHAGVSGHIEPTAFSPQMRVGAGSKLRRTSIRSRSFAGQSQPLWPRARQRNCTSLHPRALHGLGGATVRLIWHLDFGGPPRKTFRKQLMLGRL
jgi:hypothetical protein